MDFITLIGIVASVFTALSLLPQLIKIVKERKSDTISFGTLAVLFTGLSFWVYYGILKKDYIIIIANAVSLMINVSIFILSLVYKRQER